MTKINDGGPAFGYGDHVNGGHSGMTLRDWFAGQALSAILEMDGAPYLSRFEEHARAAYAQADAMLAVREADPS